MSSHLESIRCPPRSNASPLSGRFPPSSLRWPISMDSPGRHPMGSTCLRDGCVDLPLETFSTVLPSVDSTLYKSLPFTRNSACLVTKASAPRRTVTNLSTKNTWTASHLRPQRVTAPSCPTVTIYHALTSSPQARRRLHVPHTSLLHLYGPLITTTPSLPEAQTSIPRAFRALLRRQSRLVPFAATAGAHTQCGVPRPTASSVCPRAPALTGSYSTDAMSSATTKPTLPCRPRGRERCRNP